MALTLPHTPEKEKVFNGLRRTQDGMLYLTTIDPNKDSENVQYSNFFESGKSDSVPKDGSDYTEERLELFNTQFFIGDNSTTGFILNANNIPTENLVVFKDNVLDKQVKKLRDDLDKVKERMIYLEKENKK